MEFAGPGRLWRTGVVEGARVEDLLAPTLFGD